MDADAPSAPSWSSITSGPTRWEVRRLPRTSPFAVGATINTRRSWSLVLGAAASKATPESLETRQPRDESGGKSGAFRQRLQQHVLVLRVRPVPVSTQAVERGAP